jgi:hypothetical protein
LSAREVTQSYSLAPRVSLRELDGAVVAYVGQRFETHLLDDASAQVLDAFKSSSAGSRSYSAHGLVEAFLAGEPDAQNTEVQEVALAALMPLLTELVRLGVLTINEC